MLIRFGKRGTKVVVTPDKHIYPFALLPSVRVYSPHAGDVLSAIVSPFVMPKIYDKKQKKKEIILLLNILFEEYHFLFFFFFLI